MASAARAFDPYISPEEHEQIELETGTKHEWYDGEVFAMAGGTPVHNTIAGNVFAALHRQLRGQPCRPWGSDQQIKSPANRSVMYPDASVGCPPHEWDETHRNALTNPVAIIEVLSPSTASYDLHGKFDCYAAIPSLRHYVLISTVERHIDHFERAPSGWLLHAAPRNGDCVSLADIACSLCLNDAYEATDVPPQEEIPVRPRVQPDSQS